MTLHSTLDGVAEIYRRLETAALHDTTPDAEEILYLRRQFAKAYLAFTEALDDPAFQAAHPALAASLKDRMGTLRIRLMTHTLDWQPDHIRQEPAAYRKAAIAVRDLVGDFIEETRKRLNEDGID
ncbi:hypothetical protein [Aurantiacibacter gangjinensis]|uniref:Uncharacterized protein n=1 Tax=Aurantiacibacter gangjinensis TaxID=502682 RepID=A0A0G9MKE5_9SPHN|nr:hypothetical protein [Aurantiacibacter gangjinensis]APE29481.1 hypothetical protein BMF35_b0226 [Aurantiacibacter gangjinensis]KLE31142.1 hypothetical protein AAW01_13015 [Aurantiacibacter gangjinensis]